MAAPSSKCLTRGCNSNQAQQCRGLCMKCYSHAKNLVELQQTTWDELVEMGMAKPIPSLFEQEFLRRKGK